MMPDTKQERYYKQELAWRAGWVSAAYRKTLAQNPWTDPDLRRLWEEGWKAWHEAPGQTYAEPT